MSSFIYIFVILFLRKNCYFYRKKLPYLFLFSYKEQKKFSLAVLDFPEVEKADERTQ